MESGEDVPQDYQFLVPEAKVVIPTDWLATSLASLRRKELKLVVMKMLDGFFTPWDLGKAGGASALDHKWELLIKALERHYLSYFKYWYNKTYTMQTSMYAYIQLNYIILKLQ